jgi:DNA repair exonuclease SbcCD ATPase subunit
MQNQSPKQPWLKYVCAQIANLTEEKEELADELESARAQLKRKDQEIGQLRAQNEQMRAQLGGSEVCPAVLPWLAMSQACNSSVVVTACPDCTSVRVIWGM